MKSDIELREDAHKYEKRLMVALFGEERSYATYKEMAEVAEKIREKLDNAQKVADYIVSNKHNFIRGDIGGVAEGVIDALNEVFHPASSLKNEEVLDKDKD